MQLAFSPFLFYQNLYLNERHLNNWSNLTLSPLTEHLYTQFKHLVYHV